MQAYPRDLSILYTLKSRPIIVRVQFRLFRTTKSSVDHDTGRLNGCASVFLFAFMLAGYI